MSKVTIILGLAASGKTYYGNELSKQSGVKFIDEGFTPSTGQYYEKLYKEVSDLLKRGEECIITEIELCIEKVRKVVEKRLLTDFPKLKIQYVCFKNDLIQANKNIDWRAAKGEKIVGNHKNINEQISKEYSYPKKAKIICIYIPESSS